MPDSTATGSSAPASPTPKPQMRPGQMVIVFASRISERTPTFHRWADHRFRVVEIDQDEEIRTSTFRTACGLLMDHKRWVDRWHASRRDAVEIEDEHVAWVGLRFDNASLIGRPCGHCFPEAA